jgi:hypothetical protein
MKTKTENETAGGYMACVESPHRGPELIRKLMGVALKRGHVRRYLSLRRAWARALGGSSLN